MASRRVLSYTSAAHRFLSSTSKRYATPTFGQAPAPPRLPEEEQRLYEKLQQASTGAFSTPRPTVVVNQSAASSKDAQSASSSSSSGRSQEAPQEAPMDARVQATGKGDELHPNVRRGAQPEFEGETNPRTGEVGGPKNDPLRWQGDWSYNGRVSDF